ncbi:hypothetical protein PV10_06402 [Exophiala mesophila]|uniref:AAA+ ATPase domain-containing protein n=1 Tax=Exophiala mesophila TaxID=212818 RepID=A0A0D1XUM6_EXOME|nr:uncharacterized protein PV10_06402 [Exophiala mesophila]KIV91911.1 hypothetical protein PV10_06402 [Exophiala mesophila]
MDDDTPIPIIAADTEARKGIEVFAPEKKNRLQGDVTNRGYLKASATNPKPRVAKGGKVKIFGNDNEKTKEEVVDEATNALQERAEVEDSDLKPTEVLNHADVKRIYFTDGYTVTPRPADLSYRCAIKDKNDESLYNGGYCKILFSVTNHISSIDILLGPRDDQQQDHTKFRSILRFPVNAVVRMPISACHDQTEHRTHPRDRCYDIVLTYNLDNVASERVFVPSPPEPVAALAYYMRKEDTVKLHICGSEFAMANVGALAERFQEEAQKNPLAEWISNGSSMFLNERVQFQPKEKRPVINDYQAKFSFFTYDEYVIVNAIGPLEEQEQAAKRATDCESYSFDAYFAEIIGGADRVYLVLLTMPIHESIRLNAGDKVKVFLKKNKNKGKAKPGDDDDDAFNLFTAIVSEPIPGLPGCFLPLTVSRHWNKEAKKFEGLDGLKVIKIENQDSLIGNLSKMRDVGATEVGIRIPLDDNQHKHRVRGLMELVKHNRKAGVNADGLKHLLVGNDTAQIAYHDIYAGILDIIPYPDQVMRDLNEQQKAAAAIARAAPAGMVNVHGPPGTGKTHLCGEMGRPIIKANKMNFKILATSASNASTDALAVRFQGIIEKEGILGQYSVRVHSTAAEDNIARQKARLARGALEDAKPKLVQDLKDDVMETLASCKFAMAIRKTYKHQHTYFADLVPDHRVTEKSMGLSLGTRIMQLIGEIPVRKVGDPKPELDKFAELKELYLQLMNKEELDESEMEKFKQYLKEAREHVLQNAIVITTTPSLSVTPNVYAPIRNDVKMFIIDEASRILEADAIAMMGIYYEAAGRVLIGDPYQLQPPVMHDHTFSNQMKLSMQARLIGNGTPSAFLDEQYRMSPLISLPLNKAGYQKRLRDHYSVDVPRQPILEKIEQFNKKDFNVAKYCMAFDIWGTETMTAPRTRSRYNVVSQCFSMNLAARYIKEFPTFTVAIICFYKAQNTLYLAIKDAMAAADDCFSRLHVVKADSVQGLEFDVCIIDAIIGKTAGFLDDMHRLVVAISRAKYSSSLVFDRNAVYFSRSNNLKRVCTAYLELGALVKVKDDGTALAEMRESKFFHSNMTNFEGEGLVEAVSYQGDQGDQGEQDHDGDQGEQGQQQKVKKKYEPDWKDHTTW